MNVLIETKNGTVEVNGELLSGYIEEAAQHYAKIDSAKADLKLIGEALEEKTTIKATTIMKYAKARYAEKTGETTELGALFTSLDEAVAE